MSSWEQPRDGLTAIEWRLLYARLDRDRASELYPGDAEPGASYRRALVIEAARLDPGGPL